MRHLDYDLKQMQSLPLEAKVLMSQQRIRQWYDHFEGQVYISFSGGKDSTVLKHLVETTSGVYDVPSLFVNTGLEYPEIQKFAMSHKNVITVRPEMRFDEVIKTYGYPVISKDVAQVVYEIRKSSEFNDIPRRDTGPYNRRFNPESDYCKKYPSFCLQKWDSLVDADFNISHLCCAVMKKKPAKQFEKETGRKAFIGTLAEESRMRKTHWQKNGCNAFTASRPVSTPMAFWTEQDVLQYIVENNLDYCSVYGEIKQDKNGKYYTTGAYRTGCIFCMFGITQDKCPNRFQRLKETHPRQYNYCIGGGEMVNGTWLPNKQGLGLGKVLEDLGVEY